MKPGWLVPLSVLAAASLAGAGGAEKAFPSSDVAPRLQVTGEPLQTALQTLGGACRVPLGAAEELRSQRVTLLGAHVRLATLAQALEKLLSAPNDAVVFWAQGKGGRWELRESLNRRNLVKRLNNTDLAQFRKHMAEQLRWAKEDANGEISRAASDIRRRRLGERRAHALALAALGDGAVERLCSGEPLVVRVGRLDPEVRDAVRAVMVHRHRWEQMPAEELDRHSYVYLLARDPTHANGTRVFITLVSPRNATVSRHSFFNMPNPRVHPSLRGALYLPPPPPSDKSRKVTVNLAPEPKASGELKRRNLDELLKEISTQAGLSVVADGYLRPPAMVPANLTAKEYPLHTLLTVLCNVWGCRWSFLDQEQSTVLVRAEMWWMEDASDVPQALVRELRALPGGPAGFDLAMVQRLAELSPAQLHKVVDSGICPKADGLVVPGWYEPGSGAQPWVRFYNRLPAGLQAKMRSAEGLRLADTPAALVDTQLGPALMAGLGCITLESRQDVVFRLLAAADGSGFTVSARRGDGTEREYPIRARKAGPPRNGEAR